MRNEVGGAAWSPDGEPADALLFLEYHFVRLAESVWAAASLFSHHVTQRRENHRWGGSGAPATTPTTNRNMSVRTCACSLRSTVIMQRTVFVERRIGWWGRGLCVHLRL